MGQTSKRGLIDNGVAHGRGYMGNGLAEIWERRYMGQAGEGGLVDNGVTNGKWCMCDGVAQWKRARGQRGGQWVMANDRWAQRQRDVG